VCEFIGVHDNDGYSICWLVMEHIFLDWSVSQCGGEYSDSGNISKQPWGFDMLGVAFLVPQCESTRSDAGSGGTPVPNCVGGIVQQAVSSQLAAA
jgi:hypothetical protein